MKGCGDGFFSFDKIGQHLRFIFDIGLREIIRSPDGHEGLEIHIIIPQIIFNKGCINQATVGMTQALKIIKIVFFLKGFKGLIK